MERRDWLLEKRREAGLLGAVATNAIVPSRRDFSQFIASQRQDLALVPRLKRRDPQTGAAWPGVDIVGLARLLDDTDVAAMAVATSGMHGSSIADLEAIREAVDAPLLRDDLCVDELLVYDSRLRGADAVRVPVADLSSAEVERLCDIAVSLHMTPVLEVHRPEDLAVAPVRPPHCVGPACSSGDGFIDLDATSAIAALVPRHIVVVALAEPRSLREALRLRGRVDGVVVGDALLGAARPVEEVARFVAESQDGGA